MPMPIRWSVVLCFVVGLGAAEYHVSPAGGAGNPGTATLPFATIAQASAVMVAGDTCTIHAGVYRETLRPARSGSAGLPITYRAAGDGQALLSAGVEVTGWTTHSGSIWRAAMPIADRGRWNNQVFVDGIAMVEARWPNVPWTEGVGFDLLSAPLAGCTHALGSDVIRLDGPMPYGADFWNGTKVWAEIGARWCVQTATVTASTATTLTVTGKSDAWYPDAGTTWAGEAGALYLSGKLGALDAPGEWFMDGGTLYLRTERSDDPRTRRVEVRSGRLVADLSGRDHIVLLGLHGYAGSAKLSGGNCVLRGCSFRYVTQEHPSTWSTSCGLDIGGQDNLVEDCVIDGSTSHGVNLSGARNTVRNTRISNVGSMGDYSSGVFLRGTRHTVERSAITRCGRFGIYFGDLLTPTAGGQHTIRHNDIGYTNLLTQDGGAIYSWMVHGAGTEIAYNLVHDTVFWSNPAHRTSEVNGIYLDDGSKDFKVHHNVVWGVDDGIRMNNWASTNLPVEQYTVRGNHISNNTLFANAKFDMRGLNASSDRAAPFSDIVVRNNLAARSGFVGTTLSNNLVVTASSFVDAANRDFRLVSGSPAVDAGLVISGITDGYQGAAPDIGAYERGAMAWTAGVDVSRLPAPPRFVVQPASLTVTAGRNATFTVVAAGTPAPTYRWQRDGVDIGGATAATLTIAPAAVGAAYTCIIANASGVAVSEAAILTVRPATGTGTSSTGPGPSGGACGAGMAGLTMLGGILLASFRCMTR